MPTTSPVSTRIIPHTLVMATLEPDRFRRITALAAYLGRSHRASRAEIFAAVEGYADRKAEAARRLLRRDLREVEDAFGVAITYNESHDRYELVRDASGPSLLLSPPEKVALSLAIRFAQADLAQPAIQAAADLPVVEYAGWALPNLHLDAAGERLLEAIVRRVEVRFTYRAADGAIAVRRVQPWVLTWRGERYVTGFDLDRADERHFRVSRIQGEVAFVGDDGAYEPVRVDGVIRAPWESDPDGEAVLAVEPTSAWWFARRFGVEAVEEDDAMILRVPYRDDDAFAAYLAGFGNAIVVREPASLRDAIVAHLRAVLDGTGAA